MVKEKKFFILLIFALLIVLCSIVCIIFSFNENCYADEIEDDWGAGEWINIPLYFDTLSSDGKSIQSTLVTNSLRCYLIKSKYYLSLGKTSGYASNELGTYLKKYNCDYFYSLVDNKIYDGEIWDDYYVGDCTSSSKSWKSVHIAKLFRQIKYNNTYTNHPNNKLYYYVEEDTIYLHDLDDANYSIFAGWYLDRDYTQFVYKIDTNAEKTPGILNLYAKWYNVSNLRVYKRDYDFYTYTQEELCWIKSYYNPKQGPFYENATKNLLKTYNLESYEMKMYHNETKSYIPYHLNPYNDKYLKGNSDDYQASYIELCNSHYSVQYELNGGMEDPNNKLYKYYFSKYDLFSSPEPIKEGYQFLGWYQDAEFTKTLITSSFVEQDVKLYAKWAKLIPIDLLHLRTDTYTEFRDIIGHYTYYEIQKYYIFPTTLYDALKDFDNISNFSIISQDSTSIPFTYNNGMIYVDKNHGVPSYVKLNDVEYYSITYHFNGGHEDENHPLKKYYFTRDEIFKIAEEKAYKDGFEFLFWYLDEELTKSPISSSFTPQNIDLYAKWSECIPIDVYYFDTSLEKSDYVKVGTTYYYTRGKSLCFGSHSDDSQLVEYYKKYDSTSFAILNENGEKIPTTENNSYLLAQSDKGTPTFVYIYRHFAIKFYVNGVYYFETTGAMGKEATLPDFVTGFIGRNYDAPQIGKFRIGKDYALYIFKGWSLTDTSDLTWFLKDEVPLVDSYTFENGSDYVVSMYAYMEFYSKLNSLNSNIDYDDYIAKSKGIITTDSKYSLDDLMMQHVTMISSGKQNTLAIKMGDFLNLGNFSLKSIDILSKIFSGEDISLNELWDSIFGKILLGFTAIIFFIMIVILLKNLVVNIIKAS